MAGHTSEKRWDRNKFADEGIGAIVRQSVSEVLSSLVRGEDIYQDLQELWLFAGGTDQDVANQLFFDIWSVRVSDPIGNPGVVDTEANSVEVDIVGDAKAAMLAIHELYEALTNQVTATKDRIATIRRMT